MYYNYNDLFSRNALFNFIIGERGVGKTYGILKKVVKDFIKDGRQFIYLRRYKTELKYFNTILEPHIYNGEFGENEITIKGNKVYVNDKIAGYGYAISNAVTLKSSTFPNVSTIIFDEFIIDKGNIIYLNDEVTKFLEVYETIARMRDVKVYFLGNAISLYNPYFEYFNLSIPYNSQFKMYKDGLILVNYIKNEEYREYKKKTKFGKIVNNTNYGKYAIDNEMLRDNDKTFVEKKTGNCTIYCNILLNGYTLGVWCNKESNKVYISYDYDKQCKNIFAFTNTDHNELSRYQNIYNSPIGKLFDWYRIGIVRFDDNKIKYLFTTYIH
jgi:hypothetical protein